MGRGISFDYDQALSQATRQFWKKGYTGTSLRDLLKATGLGEGSFYNTLKSKKQLYLECLKRYAETEGRKRMEALTSAPTTGEGLRAMFGVVMDCLDDPATPSQICMMAGMISEEVFEDSELKALAVQGVSDFRKYLEASLLRDIEAGVAPAQMHPGVTASIILTYAQGLWRMAMLDYERENYQRQVELFLTALKL